MIIGKIEAILFAAAKPVAKSTIEKVLDVSSEVCAEAIEAVKEKFNREESGIQVLDHDGKLQFVTNPAFTEQVQGFVKEEVGGELTRPSLETLTIIAYRGPVTKPEIEQIRGINCSLILRNLLLRGLIEERMDTEKLQPIFTISTDFLRHLGLTSVTDLPQYGDLHQNERITQLLEELGEREEGEV